MMFYKIVSCLLLWRPINGRPVDSVNDVQNGNDSHAEHCDAVDLVGYRFKAIDDILKVANALHFPDPSTYLDSRKVDDILSAWKCYYESIEGLLDKIDGEELAIEDVCVYWMLFVHAHYAAFLCLCF
ncbi:hypothetical protein FLONG3_6613 [Fusarium longipes]|uniref:Uncharacterized protein n=1 Tax=Fusarium longipes TaxID=694270 RepID=A0A395SK99_9HYPO|nr:hypothetical protein FLONG3_6613 [Fusarium longipes]